MEYKINKNKKINKKIQKYAYQFLVIFLLFINVTEVKCEKQEKLNRQKTDTQEKKERKILSNIKFVLLESDEILPKIKEIKTIKVNDKQYTIFRLKSGGRVVTMGDGEFLVAGKKYKINKIEDEVEIEDSNGEKIVVGGKD